MPASAQPKVQDSKPEEAGQKQVASKTVEKTASKQRVRGSLPGNAYTEPRYAVEVVELPVMEFTAHVAKLLESGFRVQQCGPSARANYYWALMIKG